MSIDRRFIVDIFEDIVNEVRLEFDPTNEKTPYYMYGHPIDVTRQLEFKENMTSKLEKFPLIYLLLDLPKNADNNLLYQYKVSPTIFVLAQTDPSFTSTERTDVTFKPILYPITDLLIQKINESQHLIGKTYGVEYTWTDKYFWGKEGIRIKGYEGLIFNDYLDGIELNLKDLQIIKSDECF
jgi:hypothetical protein